ncbi:T9SS C-terminal target domain-containing protein [Hymenobacter sediminis]|uniref:GEVED domain-containing protein n=1 Tax=Hymenobacter sediminis TaxID=2218621 RepID=UPI000DA6A628|nr:GEVED domain-containing protein [Hymenobacter sediminis]RPD48300.1 T9SS C-terminal target domain-containing protein [Hymenobacter sediminis]
MSTRLSHTSTPVGQQDHAHRFIELALSFLLLLLTSSQISAQTAPAYCIPVQPACSASSALIASFYSDADYDTLEPQISTTNTCSDTPNPGYTLFPTTVARNTQLMRVGREYLLSVITTQPANISVWIDYDQDGKLEAGEWKAFTPQYQMPNKYYCNVQIPTSAVLGTTRMRLRSRALGKPNGAADACTAFDSGETEDYTVQLLRCRDLGLTMTSSRPCLGGTYTASGSGLGAGATYEWTGPQGFRATTASISIPNVTPEMEGQYILRGRLVGQGGTCEYVNAVDLRITPAPGPAVRAEGPARVCAGTPVKLRADGAGFSTPFSSQIQYKWSTGATTSSITVNQGGTYSVTITTYCGTATSPPFTVTIDPRGTPATPTVTAAVEATGTRLRSSAAAGNQWRRNGQVLTGETNQTILVPPNSPIQEYTVVVTSACGTPSAPSALPVVTSSASGGPAGALVTVQPNPALEGKWTVTLLGYRLTTHLRVRDALGRSLYEAHVKPSATSATTHLVDLPQVPAGIYLLEVSTAQSTELRRLLKQ